MPKKSVQPDIPKESSVQWAAESAWEDFREGLMTPWDGLCHMVRNPSLWRYGILPIVVNLLITGLLLTILIGAGVYFFMAIHPKFGEGCAAAPAPQGTVGSKIIVQLAVHFLAGVVPADDFHRQVRIVV